MYPQCPIGLPCALCLHRHRPTPFRLSPRMSRPNVPPCVTGQDAVAFNQPLSFDMSSITGGFRSDIPNTGTFGVGYMFFVRFARASLPMSS